MVRRLGPVLAVIMLALAIGPAAAATPDEPAGLDGNLAIVADIEGEPIPLLAVGKFHCNDFDFPAIHCFRSAAALDESVDAEVGLTSLLAGTDYVQIWQDAYFLGASMIVSQDYPVLAALGWNDRISSFKGRNSQTGMFFTDWFAGGSWYGFCCNQQVSSLGSYNDTFSSVYNN